jgi:hypothetical protein
MSYARKNWKTHELKIALANPVHALKALMLILQRMLFLAS